MSILTRRVNSWARALPGVRHASQAGFMKGLGTHHHQYIMRHLTTQHSLVRGRGVRPLYVCQIDFAKAFDTVPRGLHYDNGATRIRPETTRIPQSNRVQLECSSTAVGVVFGCHFDQIRLTVAPEVSDRRNGHHRTSTDFDRSHLGRFYTNRVT